MEGVRETHGGSLGRLRRVRGSRGASLRTSGVPRLTRLLDTNAASRYLRRKDLRLVARVATELPHGLAVCTVVGAELRYGIAKAGNSPRRLADLDTFLIGVTILDFDRPAARIYGSLRAFLERAGAIIGPNDLMIASIALADGLTLVTHNVAEFSRVPDLNVEDWEV